MRTEITEMNGDILIEGLPALKIEGENYLIYSPYKKVFVKITQDALNAPDVIERLKDNEIFDLPQPQNTNSKRIVLAVTKKCNLFCQYCFANSGPHIKEEMSADTAVGIIKNLLASHDLDRIHFTGGEPTLNFESIKAIVSYLEKARVDPLPVFYITTNGIMKEDILKWLIDKRFAFSVSWDGLEDNIKVGQRSYITGKKSEERTRNTILQISKSKLPLRVRMAVSSLNLPYLYDSVQWLAEHGVKFVHMDTIVPDGRGEKFVKRYGVKTEQFLCEFFRILELAEAKNIWILNSSLANLYTPKDYYCTSLKGKIDHFNPDGSISHCYRVQSFKDKLADYFITGNFGKNGKFNIDQERSDALSSINVSKYQDCENHFLRNFFSGGCPYRNFAVTESWNRLDQNACQISSSLYKRAILHIYRRALEGKPSALEGYIHFYSALARKNPTDESCFTYSGKKLGIPSGPSSLQFIPIPAASLNQNIDIDACDICV